MTTWRQHLVDVLGASGASILATALDGILYTVLLYTQVESGRLSIGVAAGIAAVFGGLVHWGSSRFWVFQRFSAPVARSALGYAVMSGMAALGHGVLTQWWSTSLGGDGAWFLSKGILWITWTYPVSRYLIFGGWGREKD